MMHGMNIFWIAMALAGPAAPAEPTAPAATDPSAEPAPESIDGDVDDTTADDDAPDPTTESDETTASSPQDDPAAEAEAPAEPPFDPAAQSLERRPKATTSAPETTPAPVTSGPAVRRKQHTYRDIPIRWRLDLGASGGTTFVPDRAFFAFTPGRRHLTGFTIDGRVDFPVADGRVFLGGGVSYRRFGRADGLYDGRLDTTLLVQDPLALGRVSVRIVEGVDAYGQVGGGPSIVDITTANSTVDRNASQRSLTGAFEAVGGLALYLPKRWLPRRGSSRMTGGFDLALGYGFRGRIDVAPNLQTEDDAIATTSTSLGDVALRGLVWRAGLFIRFM